LTLARDQSLSLSTKTRIYHALDLSVLLHAAETWTVLVADMNILETFHFRRQAVSIHALDQVENIEFGTWISPFVPDYHLSVTSSVNGGLLFSATCPGC